MSRTALLLLSLACVVVVPRAAAAQGAANLAPDDPVYRDVDVLRAAGLVDTVVVGMRPWSWAQVERLAREGEARARGASVAPATQWALERLRERLARRDSAAGGAIRPIDEATLDVTGMGSPARGVPSNGLGEISVDVDPLASRPGGARLHDGPNVSLTTRHSVGISDRLAIVATPRLYAWGSRAGGTAGSAARLEQLYGRVRVGRLALELGRDHLAWGQGRTAGLTLSSAGPSLDQLQLSTDRPLVLPWLLAWLGPTSFSVVVADLGRDQTFPHAKLAGWRGTVAPWSWFQLSLHTIVHTGGSGAPPASFAERAADLFPIIDAFVTSSDLQISNKLAGGDILVRVPRARGLEMYFEQTFDDVDGRRMASSLWQDGGQVLGAWVPRLTGDGRVALRVEGRHTGLRYYTHLQFLTGVTTRRQLVGDQLGPNAGGAYATLDWQRTRDVRLSVDVAHELRSNDHYRIVTTGAHDYGFRFVRDSVRPREIRRRVVLTAERGAGAGASSVLLQGGYEHVSSFAFTSGSRDSWLARVGLTHRF